MWSDLVFQKEYLKLDEQRRQRLHSDGAEACLFQPLVNYRTLEFDKPFSTRMVWNIVARRGNWGGVGKLSRHDLRRTAITRARDRRVGRGANGRAGAQAHETQASGT